jgi:hypothetical protein
MTRRANPSGRMGRKPRKPSRHTKLWTLRDPEMLSIVFQTFEALTTLRQRCSQNVTAAREEEHMLQHMLLNADQSGLLRWSRLSEMVITNWSLLDHAVQANRLDPAQFQEAYRKMLWIRTAWGRLDPKPESLKLIDQITDHLRQLLIRYAQAQGQPRRRRR